MSNKSLPFLSPAVKLIYEFFAMQYSVWLQNYLLLFQYLALLMPVYYMSLDCQVSL